MKNKINFIINEMVQNLPKGKDKAYISKFIQEFSLKLRQLPNTEYFRKLFRNDYFARIDNLSSNLDFMKTHLKCYVTAHLRNLKKNGRE